MKEYPKINEDRKKQLIDFMEKYRKKGKINRTVIVSQKKDQREYDFMHDWLESNNIEIIGKRVDEYDYTEPLEEKEISQERKEYLINYLKDNIVKDRIPEHLLFQIQKNDNELDFMYDWLEDHDITITGINSSLIGEIPDFKNIFRDGTTIELPDYEPLSNKRKEQLKYLLKKKVINKSISNDELLKLAQDELEYLYMSDRLKRNNIEIKNIDPKHRNMKKSYKQVAYEEANKMDIELFKKMEQGDKKARNKIIEHNLRLASWVAHEYKTYYYTEEEDRLHYARIGLIKAVERFDYKKGYKFSTYAVRRMKWDIDRYLYKELLIKTPIYILEKLDTMKRIQENFENLGIRPTDEMILESAPDFGSIDRIRELRNIAELLNYNSLEEIDEKTEPGKEIENNIIFLSKDDQEIGLDESVDKRDLKSSIDEVLGTLTEREEKVLRLRFGLDDGRSQSLEEVGQAFKVTRERVRQIEAKGLRKLRHPIRRKKVEGYLYDIPSDEKVYIEKSNGSAPYQVGLKNDFEENLDKYVSFSNGIESEINNDYDDEVIKKKPEVEFEELLEQSETEKIETIQEIDNLQERVDVLVKRVEDIRNKINDKHIELQKCISDKEVAKSKAEELAMKDKLKEKKEELKALNSELGEIEQELKKIDEEQEEK